MNMLRIENLTKSFGSKKVLDGVNLGVPKGSIFGFIGKNGAGKTTTMKMVLGLLESDTGVIEVAGEKVSYGETKTNRLIGYLPDVPEFYSYTTPREYLAFCGNITGLGKCEIKSRSEELLKLVGLADEKRRIKGFSRGMKQRLGIAQALLARPKLLLCDEPTSALDPVGRKEILDILMSIKGETTVLFSTHILSDVERICTDVAFLNDGKVLISGKLPEIKERYRKDQYVIEMGIAGDMDVLMAASTCAAVDGAATSDNRAVVDARGSMGKFPKLMRTGDLTAMLDVHGNGEESVYEILKVVTENRLSLVRLEKLEPSLESMFMEVVRK